jgi:hypothetical protein
MSKTDLVDSILVCSYCCLPSENSVLVCPDRINTKPQSHHAGKQVQEFTVVQVSLIVQNMVVKLAQNSNPSCFWWFCSDPSIIREITSMNIEMRGTVFTAQHKVA